MKECTHDKPCDSPGTCDCHCETCFEEKLDRADRLYDAHGDKS